MHSIENLLTANQQWAATKISEEPNFFAKSATGQQPPFLWIGCSDSRVPPNTITGTQPGDMFVHRNIANLVIPTDINLLSVLDYAVTHLKVQHIIVCGHYGCGGVNAAMSEKSYDHILNMWLSGIKDVYNTHKEELKLLEGDAKANRLVELNVIEQVKHLSQTTIIQKSWKESNQPCLHGWVYNLQTGIIHTLCEIKAGTQTDKVHTFIL